MATNCLDVTQIVGLNLSLLCALGGYLTPYWQLSEISQKSGDVLQIQVGLNYACAVGVEDSATKNQSLCKALPLFYSTSISDNHSVVFTVRCLLTLHLLLLVTSLVLYLASLSCQHRIQCCARKTVSAATAVLSAVLGTLGLAVFAAKLSSSDYPFDAALTPETKKQLKLLSPQLSFYLSCAGCILFTISSSLQLVSRFRGSDEQAHPSRVHRISAENEVSFVYGKRGQFLDPTVNGEHSLNYEWTRVESCHVDVFRTLFTN